MSNTSDKFRLTLAEDPVFTLTQPMDPIKRVQKAKAGPQSVKTSPVSKGV